MDNKEIAKIPEEPLIIFKTEEVRVKNDILLMSNFFDNYINQLCVSEEKGAMIQAVNDIVVSNIGLINDAVKKLETVYNNDIVIVPDFDSLSSEIKTKLKNGDYKVAESRQVNGNLRPTIVDQNNVRVKDITLRKEKLEKKSLDQIDVQMQLKEIYNKLIEIQDMQEYQIKLDRNRDFVNPFLSARNFILEAETEMDLNRRKEKLLKADEYIANAIVSVESDLETTSKHIVNIIGTPIKRFFIDKFLKFVVEDIQVVTKYVGVRMQLLEYLNEDSKSKIAIDNYKSLISDFFTRARGKKGMTMADIMQNYYPYNNQNKDLWYEMKKKYIDEQKLMSETLIEGKEIYVLTLDDGGESEYEK